MLDDCITCAFPMTVLLNATFLFVVEMSNAYIIFILAYLIA